MKFNFKEALEHSRTPEGKAEDFLKESLKVMKKMTPFNELSFKLSTGGEKLTPPYFICSVAENGNIIYRIDKIQDYDEALSIFQAIENQLKKEGYSPEPAYPVRLKHFKIKL